MRLRIQRLMPAAIKERRGVVEVNKTSCFENDGRKRRKRRGVVVSGRIQTADIDSSAPRDPGNVTGDHDK